MGKMADLREALAVTLEALDGVQESAYVLGNSTPPAAEIEPAPITYDLAMQRGLDEWRFTVRVFVAMNADIGSQVLLDSFIEPVGDQSVKTLIEADRTLGGLCDFVQVESCSGYKTFQSRHSGQMWLGAEWAVCVRVSN